MAAPHTPRDELLGLAHAFGYLPGFARGLNWGIGWADLGLGEFSGPSNPAVGFSAIEFYLNTQGLTPGPVFTFPGGFTRAACC
jgi:hypothetical protein